MKVLVALQEHFWRDNDGLIYPETMYDYAFWSRYLDIFDEVKVFARVASARTYQNMDSKPANGPKVSFYSLPNYHGPWEYIKVLMQLQQIAKDALRDTEACILRVPGEVGSILWKACQKQSRPFGLEVVGDPWDSLAPGSVKSILRPFARRLLRQQLMRQCHEAPITAYVTESKLQSRYPPSHWSTYYSSIDLPKEYLASNQMIAQRSIRILNKPFPPIWRLCHIGTLAQLYKAPDILIKAVAQVLKNGIHVELHIIGEGQFRKPMEVLCQNLGIDDKVYFLGKLPRDRTLFQKLDTYDMFILPSRQEGLPRALIEAMARGLPCIGSDVGGIPELLSSDWMVPPNNIDLLANKIIQMLNNPSKLASVCDHNVHIASLYTQEHLNEKRNLFYKRLKDITHNWFSSH